MATRIDKGIRRELTKAEMAEKTATKAVRDAEIPPKPNPNTGNIISLLIAKGVITQSDIDGL